MPLWCPFPAVRDHQFLGLLRSSRALDSAYLEVPRSSTPQKFLRATLYVGTHCTTRLLVFNYKHSSSAPAHRWNIRIAALRWSGNFTC